jgi:DNA-directed RNA polymerase specialized sigma24 family protein
LPRGNFGGYDPKIKYKQFPSSYDFNDFPSPSLLPVEKDFLMAASLDFQPQNPDTADLTVYFQQLLEVYHLRDHSPEDILAQACLRGNTQPSLDFFDEIQQAYLKTTGLEIIQELDQARTENRMKFERAIAALFDDKNPESAPFCAGVKRMLYQFRLAGTYEEKEILAEAYSRGIKKIEDGVLIEIPLAWLRTACLNVIREFSKKQKASLKPKFDKEPWEIGDTVLTELMLQEDLKAIVLAAKNLTSEERHLLCLRVFSRWTWQKIGESLTVEGEPPISAGTARKRGSRSLRKLREYYDEIRVSVKLEDEKEHVLLD